MPSDFRGDFDKSRFYQPSDVLNIVLEHISHGLVVVGRDYRLLAFNRVMDSIFQLPEGTFEIGQDFRRVIETWARQTGQDQDMLERALRELDAPEPFVFEHHQNIHGNTRWLQLIHNPLPTGGFVRTFMDITERKTAELALQDAVEELKQASTAKDQFLRLVSHDLRSPIAGLVSLFELLHDFHDLRLEEQQELLEEGLQGTTSLLSLTEHLLKVSRLRSGAIIPQKKPTSMAELLQEIHARHKVSLHQKGIDCRIDVPPDTRWLADRLMMGEVFDNLFSNSLKFCDNGDELLITQASADVIEFRDSGPGIPEKFLDNLFRPEVKTLGQGSRGEKGTGLGLPHAADIMTAHGGTIEVRRDGPGAHFVVRLPRHARSVLIVDDQAAHRAMIRDAIAATGDYNVIEAANGKDAMETIETLVPDIVILDLEMPEMDGWELLATLRARQDTARLPIMIASSHLFGGLEDAGELIDRLRKMGADHVEAKPIRKETFNQAFIRLLG